MKTNTPRLYGEPFRLKGDSIYFTSWKYVRQGGFGWTLTSRDADSGPSSPGIWGGDGSTPAEFRPNMMPSGIRLVARPAEKVPIDPEQIPSIATIIRDEGRYRAWYYVEQCPQPEPFSTKDQILQGHNMHLAYAESEDGFQWTKPKLGLYEYAGRRENNIVFRGDLDGSTRGVHGGSVFIDPTSEEERFKFLYLGGITDQEWEAFEEEYPSEADSMARRRDVSGFRCVSAVFGAASPDGSHWTPLPDPLMIQHADTLNTCYYDLDRQQYIAYVRAWQVSEKAEGLAEQFPDSWIRAGRRSIGRAVSDDFRHFSKTEIAVAPGADMAPSHLWYTNAKTALPGSPDQHVMFPWRWELECDGGDLFLFSSADGWHWSQVPGGPVLTRGKLGEPDGCFVACGINLVELPGDRWGVPYAGVPIPHKYPGRDLSARKGLFPGVSNAVGYACWPKGRLVALECPDEGEFGTVGVVPPGNQIRLNAIVPPTGYVKAAVVQLGKGIIPGRDFDDTDRLLGDDLAMPVTWNGEPDLKHEGHPIILAFKMKQVKLFGVSFC